MLLFLLLMSTSPRIFSLIEPANPLSGQRFFVEISGDVGSPGVYSFEAPPTIGEVLVRGGAVFPIEDGTLPLDEVVGRRRRVGLRTQRVCSAEMVQNTLSRSLLGRTLLKMSDVLL